MIQSKGFRIGALAALTTIGVALAPTVANATPGLTLLGSTNGGYSFADVASPNSDLGSSVWVPSAENPVIVDTNIYAAFPLKVNSSQWNVYYGGWAGSSGNDDIFLRTTGDPGFRAAYYSPQTKIIDHGYYVHANDPSVVLNGSTYTMALTTYRDYDWCSVLQSSNGTTWPALTSRGNEVSFTGATVSSCARPSLNWNPTANRWEMYFDGVVNGGALQQHVAYSTQTVPTVFAYQQSVGPFVDADMRRLANGSYVGAFRWTSGPQPVWDIRYATSSDGLTWTTEQPLLAQDPDTSVDDYGVTNPGLAIDGSSIIAMLYGENDSPAYNSHNIGVAYPQLEVTLTTGSIYHVHRHADGPDGQTVSTYGYTPDGVIVKNAAGTVLLNQPGTLSAGHVWSVQNRTLAAQSAVSASETNAHASFPASNAIDGNVNTFSSTNPVAQVSNQSVTLDLGSATSVRGLQVTRRADGPYGFPVDFSVAVSLDGATWAPVALQGYTSYPTPGTTPVVLAFAGTYPARYVRIASTKQSADQYGNYYLQFAELAARV